MIQPYMSNINQNLKGATPILKQLNIIVSCSHGMVVFLKLEVSEVYDLNNQSTIKQWLGLTGPLNKG